MEKSTLPNWTVKEVVPREDGVLLITFVTGEQKTYDCKPLMEKGVFRDLRNPAVFNQAHVDNDTVVWGEEIDIAPETLYADGVLV